MPAFTITAALTVAHLISSFASLEPLNLKHVSPKRGGATISNLAGMSVGFGDLGRGGGGEGGENRPFLGIHFTKNEREDHFIKL